MLCFSILRTTVHLKRVYAYWLPELNSGIVLIYSNRTGRGAYRLSLADC